MKQIIKFTFMAVAVATMMTACAPQEFDNYSLGDSYKITQDQFTFDMTPGKDEWTYNFTVKFNVDPVKNPFSYEVRFGDGQVTKKDLKDGLEHKGSYEYVVLKGTYTAQCIVYNPNGDVIIKDKAVVIKNDNDKLFTDDPASLQFALTGGKANSEGKTWFIGPWTAMRDPGNRNSVWWDFKDPAIMDDLFTFKPNSVQPNGAFTHKNNGNSFMNESLGTLFPDGNTAGSFVTVNYNPPTNATWEVTKADGKTFLTINNGFFGYATAPDDLKKTVYEVISFTTSSIRLVLASGWDGWCYEITCEMPHDPLTNNDTKTWVIDANNKHLDEVKAATGKNLKGHMGLGPINSFSQEWWGAAAGDKSYDNTLASVGHGWTLYDWKITFSSTGQMRIVTAGEGFGRAALDGSGGFNSIWKNADDMAFKFDGGIYTYTKTNAEPYPKLKLSGDAFFGYYVGTQDYEIIYLSNTALAVAAHNTKENQDWVFILCPEGEK